MPFLRQAWYCAAWDHEVGRKPMARRILGTPVLLFRKEDGQAVAMGDRCPHRFAPLSAGTVIGDQIRCAYHGLTFDSTGACVRNPHGKGKIPSTARVPSFPLVERQHALWIWMGDPAYADPEQIVDLELIGDADHPFLSGLITMDVHYLLVADNLLDLTHAPYLHGADIAPPTSTREATFEAGENWVASTYLGRAAPTPGLQRPFFEAELGDHHTRMRWTAPGTICQFLAITDVGHSAHEGAISTNAHLLTPETENSTHYFWGSARNRRVTDAAIDEQLRTIVHKAFVTEDEPMIAACRDYMEQNDLLALHPVMLETDAAAIRARRIIDRLLAREKAARIVPSSKSPSHE